MNSRRRLTPRRRRPGAEAQEIDEAKAALALAETIVKTLATSPAPTVVLLVGLQEAMLRIAMQRKPCSRLEAYDGLIGMFSESRDQLKAGTG